MLKAHFNTSLTSLSARKCLHFAAHSHHPWPDCTQAAQAQYWLDSAQQLDRKWGDVLGAVLPEAQGHISRLLHTNKPANIAFAPNTGEFVARLYSALDWTKPLHVITTDGEFHSFARQTARLEESGRLTVTRISVAPIATFADRLIAACQAPGCDMIFLSHVFFESGVIVPMNDLRKIVSAAPRGALVAIDGYHSVMALPIDISTIEEHVFFIGGGYKYMMAGEGCCFMHVPAHAKQLRPAYTGWFAAFDHLTAEQGGQLPYADDGYRFFGATFDASGLYRLNAVQRLLNEQGVTVHAIRQHVLHLKRQFVKGLFAAQVHEHKQTIASALQQALQADVGASWDSWIDCSGNYVSIAFASVELAAQADLAITKHNVIIDRRANRVRFGFGVYHDASDVCALLARLDQPLL